MGLHRRGGQTAAEAGAVVAPAFTHLVSYETNSEGYPEDNATPYASPEQVANDLRTLHPRC